MAVTYTHNVVALKKDNEVVKSFTLAVTASENSNEYSNQYNVVLDPTGSTFINYNSLAEDNVINWYLSSSVESDRVQTDLINNLYIEVTGSFPWNS